MSDPMNFQDESETTEGTWAYDKSFSLVCEHPELEGFMISFCKNSEITKDFEDKEG